MPALVLETELAHPPARVWRALTDRRLLAEWFMATDLEPDRGRRFRLFPDPESGLPGPLEGELVELSPPYRVACLLRGEATHARLTIELRSRPGGGCHLRLVHTAPLGRTGGRWRRGLASWYRIRVEERLPAVLARLADAAGTAAFAADPPVPAAHPPVPAGGPAAPRPGFRRRPGLLLAGAGVLVTVAVVATAALVAGIGAGSPGAGYAGAGAVPLASPTAGHGPPDGPDPAAQTGPATPGRSPSATASGFGPAPASGPSAEVPVGGGPPGSDPSAAPGASAATGPPTGTASPAGTASPGGAGPAWRAAYRTTPRGSDEYLAEVTVTNAGPADGTGWAVSVTIADGAVLASVSGAGHTRTGTSLTFGAPGGAGPVPPGGSVAFAFRVTGDGRDGPRACAVDGQPCAGSRPGRRNELPAAGR